MTTPEVLSSDLSMADQQAIHRQRAIRIQAVTGLLLVVASLPTLFTTAPTVTQQYIGNIITLVMGLLALASAWVSYKVNSSYGSIFFIVSILVLSLGIPIYAHGLGLQAGIITAVIVVAVAVTTLPGSQAALISIIAFVTEAVVVLADLYLPDLGFGELESPTVNIFLAVIVVAAILYVLWQYRSYTLRGKLVIFFALVAFTAVSTVATGINLLTRRQIIEQVGLTTATSADEVAEELVATITSHINLLETAATQFEETAQSSMVLYSGTREEIEADLIELDQVWKSAEDDDPLVQGVFENAASDQLREFQRIAPDHVEVFLTNQYGATIAATSRLSDYYQADEEWWQVAYDSGHGAVYVSQPKYDVSSETYAIEVAVPVFLEDGGVVGVLRSTIDVSVIKRLLEQSRFGETGEAVLQLRPNALFGSAIIRVEERAALNALSARYGQLNFNGTPSMVSSAPLLAEEADESSAWISRLGWAIIVHQDLDEALQPVEEQTRTTITIAIFVLVLAALAGLFASQRIAAPIVSLTQTASQIVQGDLNSRAAIETQDEIGTLANTFNQMTAQLSQTLSGLELRIAERTADLEMARLLSERRAQELQSISEISRIISGEQRLETLLSLVTRLVSERFDFYHTGIFLIDDTRQFAVLQAANSDGGQRMLTRGHRLEVGQTGIVGNVAQTGQLRIALDVGTDAVYFDNPDLPETRSEMALPLNVRGVTVGVMDVQSTRPGVFTQENANTLSILADQIAIAIDNARLFGQNRQALAEVQSLYNQYLRQEWSTFGRLESQVGYIQSPLGGRPVHKPVDSEEIRLALQNGSVVIVDGKDKQSTPSIVVPVRLRGQTIGVLNIKAPTQYRRWSQDELNLAQAVSDRLALALDNARLLFESQRQTAKEQKIGEVTAKIGASINLQNVLQTAVEELGRALPGSEVVIQFQSDNGTK